MFNLHENKLPAKAVSALLVPCTSRKKVTPDQFSRAVSLNKSQQSDIETAWIKRLEKLPEQCEARKLYCGRGFQLGLRAAHVSGAPLYIVSAGLGLVSAEATVPTYGITVSGKGEDSLGNCVTGHLNPENWWSSVSRGPYSTEISKIIRSTDHGHVVIALSQPYAQMLAPSLLSLSASSISRLRILGSNLARLLPPRLAECVMPYDERLEAIFPGTRSDFAQRALLHFVSVGLSHVPFGDLNAHREWVSSILSGKKTPIRKSRNRLADEEILKLICQHLPKKTGVGRLLRILRDEEGVACEQARFSRLYQKAINERISG